MPPNREVKIIKVPLSAKERMPDYPPKFPYMPRMYLELLENKAKIKQDLINKEYVPPKDPNAPRVREEKVKGDEDAKQPKEPKGKHRKTSKRHSRNRDTSESDHDKKDKYGGDTSSDEEESDSGSIKITSDDSDEEKESKDEKKSNEKKSKDEESDEDVLKQLKKGKSSSTNSSSSISISSEDIFAEKNVGKKPKKKDSKKSESLDEDESSSSSGGDSGESKDDSKDDSGGDSHVHRNKKSSASIDVSARLKELFEESKSSRSGGSRLEKYSNPIKHSISPGSRFKAYESARLDPRLAPHGHLDPRPPHGLHGHLDSRPQGPREPYEPPRNAPTLAELEAMGQYQRKPELRDINHITTTEYEEEDKKRELIFKFSLLRKSFPLAQNIPEFTIHSDLREMQKTYETTLKELTLSSSVDTYKQYLIYGFFVTEWVFGSFLGFDMQGFSSQQVLLMSSYDKLLIELGEKSYVPGGSRWPVELRLLFVIVSNAAAFIFGKMVMKSTGANMFAVLNSLKPSPNNTIGSAPQQKRRMRGPTTKFDDLPNVDEVDGTDKGGEQKVKEEKEEEKR